MLPSTTATAEDLALRAAAFDALPSQVAVLDTDGTILATNGAWRSFAVENSSAIDPEMVGENYLAACATPDADEYATKAADGLRSVIAGERESFSFEYPCHGPDERRWFSMRAIPITHDGASFVLVMHTDITERRETELAVQERNDALELLAGVLSHDLRNPLGVALGRCELLEDGEHVDSIRSSLERMNDIVDDALTLVRGTEPRDVGPVNLATIARDAWSHVETGEATLETTDTCRFEADATLLTQAFENLLRNAVENAGADVTVTVGPLSDGHTGFFVADDGPGIPADDRDAVLEAGFTTNRDEGGTGLGLAIVERIADAHGWEMRVVESEQGGAQFEFGGVTSAN